MFYGFTQKSVSLGKFLEILKKAGDSLQLMLNINFWSLT